MPMTRLPRSWPGYLPSMAAAAVTLGLTAAYAAAAGGSEPLGTLRVLLLLFLIPVPVGLSVIWGSVFLTSRPFLAAVVGAGAWLALSYFLLPRDVVWQMTGNVAAGLAAGLALGLRWRLDAALAVVVAALLPVIVWALIQVPVQEQLEVARQEMLSLIEESIPESASLDQRTEAMEDGKRNLEEISSQVERIYPFVITLGLFGQAGIILVLVLFSVRRLGFPVQGWMLPPFSRWRLPFYLVWLLVLGVGMMLTRTPYVATAGLNLMLLAASILSVQGIAVQFHVTNLMLSNLGRVVYWVVMGVLFAPLLLASGVVLGLVDQWVDLRRLQVRHDDEDGNAGDSGDIE
jgi:MFS family permease